MALFVVAWSPRHALEYSLLRDEGCVLEVLILCSFGPTGLIPHASNLCWTGWRISSILCSIDPTVLVGHTNKLFIQADESVRYSVLSTPRSLLGTPTNFFIQRLRGSRNAMLGVSLLPMSDTADPLSVFGSGLPEGKPPTSARTKAGGPMSTTIPVDPGADSWPRMICGHTGAVSAAQLAGFYNDAHCELLPHVLLSTHWPVISRPREGSRLMCS
ncbi:hypothetical protein PAPYR_11986 [Paratrimastix pyriformis]|uniref:Uncharacterized protein n=1 Tax=Paratrimastix pyriformis TaxID=342808 RepID=A0ABQ8U9N1_9EUKA|nr:hypothetical protein PAPYR_11986 [Paratrimastix pyriformis]